MNRYIIATTTEIDAENVEEAIIKQGTLTEAKRDDSTI